MYCGKFWIQIKVLLNNIPNNSIFSSGECECPVARNRGPCKHKHAISRFFNVASFSVLPVYDACTRSKYHFIATGSRLENHYYRGLMETQTQPNINDGVTDEMNSNQNIESSSGTPAEEVNTDMNDDASNRYDNDDEENDIEAEWSEFLEDINKLKTNIDLNPQVKKSFLSFKKKFHSAVNGNDNTLCRKLFDFGVEKKRKEKKKCLQNWTLGLLDLFPPPTPPHTSP